MRDITTKTPGSSLTADEFNDIPGELENAITSTDITLSAADLFQLAKAISIYAARGDYYEDDGVADAYVLNTVGNLKAPNSYEDGMRARFKAANSNTGASTVSVAGIGVVNITGTISGDIVAGEFISMEFNSTSGEFEIASQASGDMLKSTYDPTTVNGNAFARANMTGTQLSSTISDFSSQVASLTAAKLDVTNLIQGTGITIGKVGNDATFSLATTSYQGCWLGTTGSSFSVGSLPYSIPWDVENRDTDTFHTGSGSTIVIPVAANGKQGRLTANVDIGTSGSAGLALSFKIISSADGTIAVEHTLTTTGNDAVQLVSPIVDLSTGDSFYVQVTGAGNGNILVDSFFDLEVI